MIYFVCLLINMLAIGVCTAGVIHFSEANNVSAMNLQLMFVVINMFGAAANFIKFYEVLKSVGVDLYKLKGIEGEAK